MKHYRFLVVGDIVQWGDEWMDTCGEWHPIGERGGSRWVVPGIEIIHEDGPKGLRREILTYTDAPAKEATPEQTAYIEECKQWQIGK